MESVTVKVSDCPDEMLPELAVIEIVGVDGVEVPELTVIVVWALTLPLEFIAVAVYVTVEVGATAMVPPE
ncbi:MAG: hypothetical protein WBQ95_03490 [Terracidiphilus sp.]